MPLTATTFDQAYYEEHRDNGLDYRGHGWWQQSYARMVQQVFPARTLPVPPPAPAGSEKPATYVAVLDIGCACGSILAGFRGAGLGPVVGVEVNPYMVDLGREDFGFSAEELRLRPGHDTGLADASVALVHSAQVFEHIAEAELPGVLTEMRRVMLPGAAAFLCLDAVKDGQTAEMYQGDPTHITLKSTAWWLALFEKHGFVFDVEAYERFARAPQTVEERGAGTFFEAYTNWSVFTLRNGA